jgi:lipopolysaccharide export system ATP-binding protein
MTALVAEHLSKKYKGGRHVVRDVSLQVSAGQIVGLLGPNGAGKTTCFYMIVGLIPTDGGVIRLHNHDISQFPMHRRARLGLGYLPQEPSVFRNLTVAQNIAAILETRADLSKTQRAQALEELLQELRIEIARALATNPRFMLLDEPFAGVDPISVLEIQTLIRDLQKRGLGVLITDHNVRETLKICDHAYILSDGHVLTSGTPDEILYNDDVKRVYLGQDFKL